MSTNIEWTEETWNPIVGCTIVSAGCTNCYAQRHAYRMEHALKMPGYEGTTKKSAAGQLLWTGKVNCLPERLDAPLRRRKPTRYFVNSMSDLFHEDVPDEFIDRVFAVMALTPWHTYQVLTKRPERMLKYLTSPVTGPWAGRVFLDDKPMPAARFRHTEAVCSLLKSPAASAYVLNRAAQWWEERGFDGGFSPAWPLPNVWLGVSVENQAAADERIPLLLQTPAAVRWLSCEPLLGPVEFSNVTRRSDAVSQLGKKALTGIDWVVAGGESGPGARPMHPDWARGLRDQCQAAGVPFFFKQWGEWEPKGNYYGGEAGDDSPSDWYHEARVGRALLFSSKYGCWDGDPDSCAFDGQPPTDTEVLVRVGKGAAGRLLDGREWNEYPNTKEVA